MKTLFKGGYPTPLLNGLKCVNCGSHHIVGNKYYEAMGNNISGHSDNIISFYFMDDNMKAELSVWKNTSNEFCFGIAFYKSSRDTQSYKYCNLQDNNIKKYDKHKEHLINAYNTIFKGE